ncbi:MAG: nucleotide exchange factor GrpE [Bacteroidales bacterium]|nr:nucleotide exchange factor GrpE [Bacteroidales bacterium]
MIFKKNKNKHTTMDENTKNIDPQDVETNEETTSAQNGENVETPQTEEKIENNKKTEYKKHHKTDSEKIQELGEKLNELNDKYLRTYSEYENYRKRTTKEKADLLINGAADTIKAILPVIDDLERALQSMTDEASREGVQLIYNKLMNILQQKGLKEIEAKGEKFSEELHEAVTKFPAAEESQKGTVIDVVEKGYYLNDKVLRFPKVVVAI